MLLFYRCDPFTKELHCVFHVFFFVFPFALFHGSIWFSSKSRPTKYRFTKVAVLPTCSSVQASTKPGGEWQFVIHHQPVQLNLGFFHCRLQPEFLHLKEAHIPQAPLRKKEFAVDEFVKVSTASKTLHISLKTVFLSLPRVAPSVMA